MNAVDRAELDRRLAWSADGTHLAQVVIDSLDDAGFDGPSLLPGWTRRHLVAHLAANADALGHLVHWAETGEPTPMYASPEARRAGIEAGAERPVSELREWYPIASDRLATRMGALGPDAWGSEILTAQGRTVPATEIPWMRAREVLIHAVDLGTGVSFADLPAGFVVALGTEIAARRSGGPAVELVATDSEDRWRVGGDSPPRTVSGPYAELVAYLAGRPSGVEGPELGPWL